MISLKWDTEELEILNKFKKELDSITDWDSAVDVFTDIKKGVKNTPGFFEWPQNFYRIALVFFYYRYGPENMDLIFITTREREFGVRITVYGGKNNQLCIYQFYRALIGDFDPFPAVKLKKEMKDLILTEISTDRSYVGDIYELGDILFDIADKANYKYI